MQKPKPKVVSEKSGTYRVRRRSATFTVKTHRTKKSAEKHARKQIEKGKVSVIGKRKPYITFTANVKKPKAKPKKKARRRKRRR